MPGPWKPDMSKHTEIIDFSSKDNADNYISVGWELIETRTEIIDDDTAIHIYRVGWPKGAGEPIRPNIINELNSNSSPPPEVYKNN